MFNYLERMKLSNPCAQTMNYDIHNIAIFLLTYSLLSYLVKVNI